MEGVQIGQFQERCTLFYKPSHAYTAVGAKLPADAALNDVFTGSVHNCGGVCLREYFQNLFGEDRPQKRAVILKVRKYDGGMHAFRKLKAVCLKRCRPVFALHISTCQQCFQRMQCEAGRGRSAFRKLWPGCSFDLGRLLIGVPLILIRVGVRLAP
ncbi:hypothetical protein SDC9_83968 [bioreactor metagenome]|uniref:Uncharacterized protein n=1 Tax=bioreactor metagenome TaxID=1076179 RepID=A0A644ZAN5_9ZZZZ